MMWGYLKSAHHTCSSEFVCWQNKVHLFSKMYARFVAGADWLALKSALS